MDQSLEDLRRKKLNSQLKKYKRAKSRGSYNKIVRALNHSKGHWTCHLCGYDFEDITQVTVDHIIPQSDKSQVSNKTLFACADGNSQRANVPLTMFRMFQLFDKRFHGFVIDKFKAKRENRNKQLKYNLAQKGLL